MGMPQDAYGARWWLLNEHAYPTTSALLTAVLHRMDYKRFKVRLVTEAGENLWATVWAQHSDKINDLYTGRGMLAVYIEAMEIAPFRALVLGDGKMVGDVILLDEGELIDG